ncbi:MAG: hypothetical protein JWL83_1965 [Actinomycetia bacterium]|nr:hypothetical protein [Actinomycetes bacterium]
MEERRQGVALPTASTSSDRLITWAAIATVVLAVLPIVVATVRTLHRGWLPVGENALFQIRAHDVFTRHPPLIGLASSASESTRTDLHHPGPLLFDLLAVPVRLWNGAGVALGIGVLNTIAVLGIAAAVKRAAGPLFVILAMAATAVLTWTMGSELLFDPWNPHSTLLPFLCLLFVAWVFAAGDLVLLPWLCLLASFVLQTHLSYAFLVPVVLVFAIVGYLRTRRSEAPETRAPRARLLRIGAIGAVVLALCWAQPLTDQFFAQGPGNLGALLTNGNAKGPTVGLADAPRVVATIETLPPFWFRPSFRNGWLASPGEVKATPALPSSAASIATLAVLGLVLLACAWDARRRRDRLLGVLLALDAVVLAVALYTAARAPLGFFGLPLHFFRWLWAIGAFTTFAILATIVRTVVGGDARRARSVAGAGLVAVAVFALLNLPTSNQGVAPPIYGIAVMRDIDAQMRALAGTGPLHVVLPTTFNDPYGPAVMAELARRNIPFVVDKATARQVGNARRLTEMTARALLLIRVGEQALHPPSAGGRRIAYHDPLRRSQRAEMVRLRDAIRVHLERDGLRLNERGLAARRRRELPFLDNVLLPGRTDPGPLIGAHFLAPLVQHDYLVHDAWTSRVDRYVELQARSDNETVALYLTPVNGA